MITYETLYKKYYNNKTNIVNEIDASGNIISYTYKDILERVELLSDKFKKIITSNDKCLICSNDGYDFITYYLLIFKLNATVILLDKNIKSKELHTILTKTKPKISLIDNNHLELFKDKTYNVININNDKLSTNKDIKYKEEKNNGAKTIIFSSGTTSTKSGIIHKTSNLYEMIRFTNDRYHVKEQDKFITIVPNSHIYGLALNTIFCTYIATEVYYLDTLDFKILLKVLPEIKPDYLCSVTKFYEVMNNLIKSSMLNQEWLVKICFKIRQKTNINLGKLLFKKVFNKFTNMCLITAGAPLDEETEHFLFGLGFPIIEFYGATETNVPIITTIDKNKYTYGIGKLMEPSIIKINPVTNELLVKNDYLLLGYIEDSKKINEIIDQDGYINTGDTVEITKKGIYITGRTKDTIVLSTGEKVSPEDIENNYSELDVKEFTICGIPEKEKSNCDKIHLFAVTDKDENTLNKEVKKISKDLPSNMKISDIHIVKEIPKTAIGKVRRYVLRDIVIKEKKTTHK